MADAVAKLFCCSATHTMHPAINPPVERWAVLVSGANYSIEISGLSGLP